MRNPATTHIDQMTTSEMLSVIAAENYNAAKAVEAAIPSITLAVDVITESFKQGGRLFFIGAGTSGRLGIMDAAECPPTYGVPYDMVNGIIAGGPNCVFRASEQAEDSEENGALDIEKNGVSAGDVVVGISVAGGASYVVGALKKARSLGASAIALTCNEGSPIEQVSDICIITDTGAEVITGSTRMKAGSAHKMVLNMLTTCAMVKLGNVYENMMINLKPTNIKLRKRMIQIVCDICGCEADEAENLLEQNEWNIRRVADGRK